MKILNIVGARPNFMKIAPVMKAMNNHPTIKPVLVHTGQHYDEKMSKLFFDELKIPRPDINMNVGSDSHAKQVAKIMERFDDVCMAEKPDAIMVVGDVNSTMACSIVATKLGIKVIHLEAGLRSYDRTMPEEINRLVTDAIADLLLTPSADANENLIREGVDQSKIELVGNIMIDTLFHFLPVVQTSAILEKLKVQEKNFVLITLHRPANVDNPDQLKAILRTLQIIQQKTTIVFPIHPRTRKNIELAGLTGILNEMPALILTEPLGYLDFQKLMTCSRLVITDSGGVQEETTALKIPCITVRKNTERPVTVTEGSNVLVGDDMQSLLHHVDLVLNNKWKKSIIPHLWDGKTSERVLQAIEKHFC